MPRTKAPPKTPAAMLFSSKISRMSWNRLFRISKTTSATTTATRVYSRMLPTFWKKCFTSSMSRPPGARLQGTGNREQWSTRLLFPPHCVVLPVRQHAGGGGEAVGAVVHGGGFGDVEDRPIGEA